jgi:predicted RNA binding protein YcfA (HicA-like mRNA interferase family)
VTKREKRLRKMQQNPRNVSYNDFIKVLEDVDFQISQAKGSHMKAEYRLGETVWALTFVRPHGSKKSIHPASVKAALKSIAEIKNVLAEQEEQDGNGSED